MACAPAYLRKHPKAKSFVTTSGDPSSSCAWCNKSLPATYQTHLIKICPPRRVARCSPVRGHERLHVLCALTGSRPWNGCAHTLTCRTYRQGSMGCVAEASQTRQLGNARRLSIFATIQQRRTCLNALGSHHAHNNNTARINALYMCTEHDESGLHGRSSTTWHSPRMNRTTVAHNSCGYPLPYPFTHNTYPCLYRQLTAPAKVGLC